MNNAQIALDIINKWDAGTYGSQRKAALQCAIIEGLEANKKTERYAVFYEREVNKIKAEAIEEARLSLSIIIHSPARTGTFLDGADWAFDNMSEQLEARVVELTKEGE